RYHLAGPDRHGKRKPESASVHHDVSVDNGHAERTQRSRRLTRIATETNSRIRLSTIAACRSDSSIRYTSIGMVRVIPGKLPAKVMVAPNSPRARAQHSTAPAATPGATSGSVTRRKVYHRLAPR